LSRNSAKRHDPILSQVSLIERELSLAAKRVKERLLALRNRAFLRKVY